ncbi:ferric reductase like transmembrane component-domain-containing protein [Pisolithus orientalis]|uniref:ferric reductase like transmembrane component-domain-containing protein n=1 Tax=Pisolithus orientalis TaxID=936130 RepID=UPI002224845D|nr:ferric reductase like transmembrane component-domain-containing protein [Pisolithus orientalis]KAI6032650.1 ferric reductase like transmembrane component-domain-containing protein [Pisolithus orientalis]
MSSVQSAPPSNSSDLDVTLTYHLDIAISITIAIFALLNAPRAVARFANPSERLRGHILRYVALRREPRISASSVSNQMHSDFKKSAVGIQDRSAGCDTILSALPALPTQTLRDTSNPERPVHMPMLSSLVHPVTSVLTRPVHEGYTVGRVLLMAGYAIMVLYCTFYKSNPFSHPSRAGRVIASQIPFVYIFATKNNIVGALVGVGYEKLNFLHRFIGRLAVVGANVHMLGYVYKWTLAGKLSTELTKPFIRWGFVALACFDLLGIGSTQFVRSKSYNLFIVTHVLGLFIFLIAACYHQPACIPFVIAACVFYGVDHLMRIAKTCITTAMLRPIPELGLTRIEIPTLNSGWRAGQHVRLRVLSTDMDYLALTEVHPFTIANVERTEEGMVLMCKKTGRWTSKIYSLSATKRYGEQGREVGEAVRVMIEGPYGGVGNTIMSSYSGALVIAGGIGITFALSAVQELVRSGNDTSVRVIDIVWSIPDVASLTPMIALFTSLIEQRMEVCLRVSVFYTRALKGSSQPTYLPPGVTLTPGRPKIAKFLNDVVTSTQSGGGATGVFVGVCGPPALARDVAVAVRNIDVHQKRMVGGIELHEE